jgi:Fe-coproporphyrin III synthase
VLLSAQRWPLLRLIAGIEPGGGRALLTAESLRLPRFSGGPLSAEQPQFGRPVRHLPLVTLYLTDRCNSRCVTCDYWRHGRADLTLEAVERFLPSLEALQTRVALISGGEPLLNPEWARIAQRLRDSGLQLWLLTSGLALAKHATTAHGLFQAITVSLDGIDSETYAAIRGLDAFERVCAGIRAAVRIGTPVSMRVTLQRANYRQLPGFVELARDLGVRQISFIAVDVANPHAFARTAAVDSQLALRADDLPVLAQLLSGLEADHAEDFRSGFIAESPRRMHHIHQYFTAVCGLGPFPPVRCNAPEVSAVIGAKLEVSPCFFIPGPTESRLADDLRGVLNTDAMMRLRESIRGGKRPECAACVCSLWREPHERDVIDFLLQPKPHA